MNKQSRWGLVASLLIPLGLQAAQPLGCLIEPYRVSEVGSPVIGVIETTLAERGARVTAGQPLATLRADVERSSVAVAASKAQAVGELQAAEANAVLARQKLARAKDLADQQFISSQALEQARAEADVAENRLAQAREQRTVLMREHDLAQAQLGLRTIRSPITGVIVDRYLSAGERVEEKPIFRVAMVNPLRVEVVLPASFYSAVREGQSFTVTPDFPGTAPRVAKVALVDKVIDGASNTFRVRLELPNPNLELPAGLRCKADMGAAVEAPAPIKPVPRPGGRATNDASLLLQMAPVLVKSPSLRP
ncbi:efflux RND transporter periplasmic adaptor subunit [Ramlibacter sp. G-1-2-2]|uniref:Efflux RND transporter periplasmic adaptor subunit n=1 Tax=Ramlibacter agri TaxID=2728837 RepID=A0A848HBF8_9BURK|nr:efflux RND transporter periplasmic adaptor subunit [Ramlibacter agri]NML45813.1 efflux RND transporter periplasmic adaptor subunit [Ramlibacter agri]